MIAGPEAHSGRRVHWLELFFDLVMVAYVSQIAHALHGDPSWVDGLVFFAFLAAAWWAWVNATITMNLFGVRVTPSIWTTVSVAMIALGVMAAAVPDALGDRAAAFAIGNAAIRVVWAVPWFMNRGSSGQPWWQPTLYSVVPAALWLVSLGVIQPWQYVVWAIAVAFEIFQLAFLGPRDKWLSQAFDIEHLSERLGLLIVIVFGESVLTIVVELDEHWTATAGVTALLSFAAVSMLGWIFFGHGSSATTLGLQRLQLRGSTGGIRDTVMYLPFALVAAITMFASALGTAVAEAGHSLPQGAAVCLSGGISLFCVASVAESIRFGEPLRDVVVWAPVGIALPWVLLPLAAHLPSEGVVAAVVGIVAVLVTLTEITTRRTRMRLQYVVQGIA
ncbi:low temperature requirement protein A [Cryobacterium lactosi]|nr:low temperature requirement protein A [Cryobacterium lactosi]